MLILLSGFAIYVVPVGEWYAKQNVNDVNTRFSIAGGLALAGMVFCCYKLTWPSALYAILGAEEWAQKLEKK
jgi:hypothetical protein